MRKSRLILHRDDAGRMQDGVFGHLLIALKTDAVDGHLLLIDRHRGIRKYAFLLLTPP